MLKYTYIYTWDEGDMGNPFSIPIITAMIHHAYPGSEKYGLLSWYLGTG